MDCSRNACSYDATTRHALQGGMRAGYQEVDVDRLSEAITMKYHRRDYRDA